MKHVLYIISVFCLFNATLFGQNQVADTTDLKLISNINKGKVVTVTSTAYQGDYTATNVEQTPNASTIFASSVRNGWYWVKVRETVLLDATRWGLPNDGTTISEERFTSFLARTNGSSVYFPAGTYDISGFSLAEVVADISWYGEGRNTIIEGMNNFKLAGNVDINNMSFKDGEIMFRQDAFTSTSYTKNHFIVRNVYMQNCGHLVRNVLDGSNVVYYDEVIIDNVIQDTINSSGGGKAFIQWTTPAQHVSVTNILIQYNTDSSYITPIRFLGANNGLIPTTDTTMYFDNITFKNLVINATNAPAPVTNILLMAVGGEGADIIANNIHAYECNLPQFDFRGTGSEITLDGWDIYCPDVVSTAAWSDYFIINKSVAYDANDWAFIMRNSDVEIGTNSGEISGVYFESDGDKLISNTRLSVQAGAGSVVRARTNATPTHYNKLRLENSSIIHNGSSGRFAFRILDDISIIEIDGCYVDGPNSSIGESVTSDTTEILRVTNSTFHGGFQGATQRQIKQAVFLNNDFVGNDNYNFSALEKVFMSGNVFRDDTITDPNKDVDINFEFGAAKYVVFSNNFFDLKRTRRMGTLDHEFNADGLDTLIYNNNTGTVITSLSTCIPVRVDSVVYLEMKDNNIYFGGAADAAEAYPLRVLNSIDNAVIDGNNFHLQGGLPTNFFVEGLAGAFIRSLKLGDNETFTTFAEGDVTISAYADIVVHNAIDKDGNAYLTSATGYTRAKVDSADINRDERVIINNDIILDSDFGKTLISTSATNDTLFLPAGVTSVRTKYIGLEAHGAGKIVLIPLSTTMSDLNNTPINTVSLSGAALRWITTDTYKLLSVTSEIKTITTVSTTSSTLETTDDILLVDDDAAGGVVTINLSAASTYPVGKPFTIKKLGVTANVIIDANGSETIDGSGTLTINGQYDAPTIFTNGTNWFIR